MATQTPDTEAVPAPTKSKKKLVLVLVVAVALLLAAGGGWLYVSKKNAAMHEDDEEEAVAEVVRENSGPPTYLPLDNMVVNLADPGGERVAQIGVTLELNGSSAIDTVKAYLPSIRSDVLMLISQRSADELLKREGKEQLAADIQREASRHFGRPVPAGKKDKKDKKSSKPGDNENPIRSVLFSSFIVQ